MLEPRFARNYIACTRQLRGRNDRLRSRTAVATVFRLSLNRRPKPVIPLPADGGLRSLMLAILEPAEEPSVRL